MRSLKECTQRGGIYRLVPVVAAIVRRERLQIVEANTTAQRQQLLIQRLEHFTDQGWYAIFIEMEALILAFDVAGITHNNSWMENQVRIVERCGQQMRSL